MYRAHNKNRICPTPIGSREIKHVVIRKPPAVTVKGKQAYTSIFRLTDVTYLYTSIFRLTDVTYLCQINRLVEK